MEPASNKRKAIPDERDKDGQNKRPRVSCFWLCNHEEIRTRMSWPRIHILVMQLHRDRILTIMIG
jgi:hypothetical protein